MKRKEKNKFNKGDLVVSNLTQVYPDDKEWYGMIIDIHPHAPKKYPVYGHKYHIQWAAGTTSWHWPGDLKLVTRGKME